MSAVSETLSDPKCSGVGEFRSFLSRCASPEKISTMLLVFLFRECSPGLWEYLIDCLLFWLEMGVDGFRCDVAATIPLEFWVEARKKVKEALPSRKTMWIAESFGPAMIRACRRRGIPVSCDPALFKAFDIIYDYDTHKVRPVLISSLLPVSRWTHMSGPKLM